MKWRVSYRGEYIAQTIECDYWYMSNGGTVMVLCEGKWDESPTKPICAIPATALIFAGREEEVGTNGG